MISNKPKSLKYSEFNTEMNIKLIEKEGNFSRNLERCDEEQLRAGGGGFLLKRGNNQGTGREGDSLRFFKNFTQEN